MDNIKFRLHTENKIVGYEQWNFFDLKWEYTDILGHKLTDIPFHVGKDLLLDIKDKNGKDVYKGDLARVKMDDEEEFIGEVKFKCPLGLVIGPRVLSIICLVCKVEIEIIGNIYENPKSEV